MTLLSVVLKSIAVWRLEEIPFCFAWKREEMRQDVWDTMNACDHDEDMAVMHIWKTHF